MTSTSSAELAVDVTGLTKRYGDRLAVDNLDLQLPRGRVTGFVGQNGAGKTTTIRMLLGLASPTGGTGHVLGEPLSEPARYLPRVGALVEGPAAYPAVSGRRNLEVLAALGRIPVARVDRVLELVGLAARAEDQVRGYSLGMRQRLGIAMALLPSPDLLVLDEPTNGLDPAGIREMRVLISRLCLDGTTVFVSSHLLAELETIADHVVLVNSGRLVFAGSTADLLARQTTRLLLRPERPEQLPDLLRLLERVGLASTIVGDAVSVQDAPSSAGLNKAAFSAGIVLAELRPETADLEQAFFDTLTTQESTS